MFGVSEKRLRVLFCSSFLELVGHVSWLVPVKISIVTCHGLAANSRTFKHNRKKKKKKRLCMQHVYEVYGNKINKAFVKRIIYIYIYIYIYILKVTEIENVENVLWQLPLYHTFPEFLFVLVIPSLLVILYHHEILSHPLWRNQR